MKYYYIIIIIQPKPMYIYGNLVIKFHTTEASINGLIFVGNLICAEIRFLPIIFIRVDRREKTSRSCSSSATCYATIHFVLSNVIHEWLIAEQLFENNKQMST